MVTKYSYLRPADKFFRLWLKVIKHAISPCCITRSIAAEEVKGFVETSLVRTFEALVGNVMEFLLSLRGSGGSATELI